MSTKEIRVAGQRIAEFRPMTAAEAEDEGWAAGEPHRPLPYVMVLEDGTAIYPSQDDEGNAPGAWFGTAPDGTAIRL